MKVPSARELKRLNKQLKAGSGSLYRAVLRSVVGQWTETSGDSSLEQAIRSWDVPRMLSISDALVVQSYTTASHHFEAHQMAALIRKYPWSSGESRLAPKATAIETFYASERKCARTNKWFQKRRKRTEKVRPYERELHRISTFVRYVLRDVPDLSAIYEKCDLTGGATLGVHGDMTNLGRKLLADRWTVSPSALPYFSAALCANFHFATRVAKAKNGVQSFHVSERDVASCAELVNYNKVDFVPKTAKTHRAIAVEPLGNNYLQKGIDLYLRERLCRVGLNLRWQGPNQEMARQGSFDLEDGFCTIDLSSASDSIATEFVREAFRYNPDWFYFLNRIRSSSFRIPGSGETSYQKFVSMGNGFCFPLQTLLFAAIIYAVDPTAKGGVDYRVYGDDIIVRKKIFSQVIHLLKVFGFTPNARKTFGEGPFRESCGSNWYYGVDVTPMTLDRKLDSLQNLFKFINLARRNSLSGEFLMRGIHEIIRVIPDPFLFYRPFKGRPETGIDPEGLEFTPKWVRSKSLHCPQWLELHTRPIEDRMGEVLLTHQWVVMAAALRGHPSSMLFVKRRQVSSRVRVIARSGPEMVLSPDEGGEPSHPDAPVAY